MNKLRTGSIIRVDLLSTLSFTMPVAMVHMNQLAPGSMPGIPLAVYGETGKKGPAGLLIANDVHGIPTCGSGSMASAQWWTAGRKQGLLMPLRKRGPAFDFVTGDDPVVPGIPGNPARVTLTIIGKPDQDEVIVAGLLLAARNHWPSILEEYRESLETMAMFDPAPKPSRTSVGSAGYRRRRKK